MSNLIERVATQAAGAVGALRASARGLRGIFSRLSEEHSELIVLLEIAMAATEPHKRASAWADARNELLAHDRAEQGYVYAHLTAYAELSDIIEEHQTDVSELELAVATIDALGLDAPGWQAAVEQLERQVRRHSEREEEHFFPASQEIIGVARCTEIEGLYTNGRRSILHELKSPTTDDPADGR
jgi:hemerythrin superfamily protein